MGGYASPQPAGARYGQTLVSNLVGSAVRLRLSNALAPGYYQGNHFTSYEAGYAKMAEVMLQAIS